MDHLDQDQDPLFDTEAPFGRKDDGTPYKRSPEWRAKAAEAMSKGRTSKAAKRPAAKTAGKATPAAGKHAEYTMAMQGVMQIPAAVLAMASRWSPTLALDSVAFTVHAPPISSAVADLAMEDARVAAILEKVAEVGPYGAIVLAVLPLVLQVAANHKAIPPNEEMGILTPEQLLVKAGVEVTADVDSDPVQG
jgi:hypothetical protein